MGFMRVSVGDRVLADGCEAVITHIVSGDHVLVRNLTSGTVQQVSIRALRPLPQPAPEPRVPMDLSLVTNEDWAVAQMRYQAVKPLLEAPVSAAQVVKEIAASTGRHPATIYRWVQRYKQEGLQTGLIPAKRGVDPGHCRLRPEVEAIIGAAIEERYLTRNRIKATQLHRDITLNCRSAGLPVPHVNTVRNRISGLAPRTVVEGRSGKRAAREQFEPIKGHFPSADHPLAVIQIDHTKLDLIVVDETDRKPLARPWLTVATDVFSRTVAGFYLSLEAPSAASTGMCVPARSCRRTVCLRDGASQHGGRCGERWPPSIATTARTSAARCSGGRVRSMGSNRDSDRCASPTTAATLNA